MFARLLGRKKAAPVVAEWFAFDHAHQRDHQDADLKSLLGGKGAGLAEMVSLGMPVPPGFTLPTTVCLSCLKNGWTDGMSMAVGEGIHSLEQKLHRRLGDRSAPLLVSVRSGAAFSMPGMMDTVLNAGMTEEVARGLADFSGDATFAWDTYRRAITSYAQVVLGADAAQLAKLERGVVAERGANADSVEAIALAYRQAVTAAGYTLPADPMQQVIDTVKAVFASWHSDRARAYRERQGIDHGLGTAATIQAMVFGNMGETSGTGVAFSRDPSTGEAGLNGDFLVGAQGEDVVAGTHQTLPLTDLQSRWPALWSELCGISDRLEQQCADMVDLEFTVEDGKLWLLQTRVAKRSPRATFRTAVDMAEDPAFPLDRAAAVSRCRELLPDPPMLSDTTETDDDNEVLLGRGLAASPGLAVGVLSLDPDDAVARQERGQRVILAREETSPNDVHGMGASVGLVTTLGGMVSHAAVVARAWGLAAAVGCDDIKFENGELLAAGHRVSPGSVISVCGDTGRVFLGEKKGAVRPLPEVETIQHWLRELNGQAVGPEVAAASDVINDIDCLRLIGLKGMTSADNLAEPLAATVDAIQAQISSLLELGMVSELAGGRVRVSDEGKAELARLLSDERTNAKALCDAALQPFHAPNLTLKELVTAWQLREIEGEKQPNDHSDQAYDRAVIERLQAKVHAPIGPIISDVAGALPRLQRYQSRLDQALQKLQAGDQRYMAHPLLDSYHTVWFELHEELIHLSGRDRKSETEAGRA